MNGRTTMTSVGRDLATVTAALRKSTVRVHDGNRGSGSGTVWNAGGLILTNAHVVRSRFAEVEFENGRRERAELVRRDDARDLAALKIASRGLQPVTARDSASLQPGELVVAVGNPLGVVGAIATGIVQRRNRRYVIADVRLAPGNSGGPLADGLGRVVGINSMVVNGLGFAVPSEAVEMFLGARPRLGVAGVAGRVRAGRSSAPAFVVTQVEAGSIAERCGLALGDAICGTDAGFFGASEDVVAALARATSLTVLRSGVRRTLELDRRQPADAATDAA